MAKARDFKFCTLVLLCDDLALRLQTVCPLRRRSHGHVTSLNFGK